MFSITDMEKVVQIKEKYPTGTRVKLIKMFDDYAPPEGTYGTVNFVDDIGTVHINWDTGSSLGLIVDVDEFYKVVEQ